MPGNDLTSLRDLVPVAATQQATARANITTILNGILNDIEPKITPAAMDISSALSFLSGGVYNPITNLGYLHMEDRASTPAVNESLYVTSNELYFRDGSGNDVAITSGGAVSASAGNISGSGYGSPVELNWNTATAEYRLKKAAGTHDLADVVVDKAQFSDGSAYFATLGASASMAATLAYSLPVAFPASTSAMTMTSAGVMGTSRDLSIDTFTASGDISADEYKITGTKVLHLAGPDWVGESSHSYDSSGLCVNGSSGTHNALNVPLTTGDRITDINVYAKQTVGGTLTLELHTVDDTGSLSSPIQADTATGTSMNSLSLTGLTTTLASGSSYLVRVRSSGGGVVTTGNVYLTYDRP